MLKRPSSPSGQNATSMRLFPTDSHRVSFKYWRARRKSKRSPTFAGEGVNGARG